MLCNATDARRHQADASTCSLGVVVMTRSTSFSMATPILLITRMLGKGACTVTSMSSAARLMVIPNRPRIVISAFLVASRIYVSSLDE